MIGKDTPITKQKHTHRIHGFPIYQQNQVNVRQPDCFHGSHGADEESTGVGQKNSCFCEEDHEQPVARIEGFGRYVRLHA